MTLTVTAGANSQFVDWSGACSGTTTSCTIPAGASDVSATARFDLIPYTLTVTLAGTGTGTVTSTPAGIGCGTDCSESVTAGTVVTLTATPFVSSTFTGWSGGGCTGTGTCVVTMSAAVGVTATFALITNTLTITRTGTGSGTVTSQPAGITCGADCTEAYNFGTTVTLTAAADATSQFVGWTGAGCAGAGTCIVTMNQSSAVTALFDLRAIRWPDSFTRFCTTGAAAIACPGGPVGQDGFYQINVPTYSVIGGRVQDDMTGLTWERSPTINEITHAVALSYCDDLSLDGFTDWRLPNYLELVSIMNFGTVGPAFPSTAFPGIPNNSGYWTSTDRVGDATQAITVFTNYAVTKFIAKTETTGRQVRCVRGATFAGTLQSVGGNITDGRTQLVWQSTTAPTPLNWQDALAYCEALNLNGSTDWRLPNGKELMSIVDPALSSPAISPLFATRSATTFWSSSVLANVASSGYAIDFATGVSSGIDTPIAQLREVRCVR